MAQLTDLEKVRRRRQKQRTTQSVLLLLAFAAVVFISTAVVRQAGDVNLKTAYSDITAGLIKGAGYPMALPGGKILRLEAAGDMLLLLSDTNIYTYNATGGRMLSKQHGMSNPVVVPARGSFLIYDRGGNKISTMTRSSETGTMASEFLIYAADIAENGNFAIATNADKHLAQVTAYNKGFKEIFRWRSTLPIISVAVSGRSNEMLVGRVDVKDGEYISSLSKLQFSYGDKPIGQAEFAGELLLSADYRGSGVRVITDKRAVALSGDLREIGSYTFGDKPIDKFADGPNGRLAVALGDYSKDRRRTVVMLDSKMEETASFTVNHDITDIRVDGRRLYISGGSSIDVYDFSGKQLSSAAINGVAGLAPIGETLYYTTSLELGSFAIKDLAEATEKNSSSSKTEKKNSGRVPVPEPEPESESSKRSEAESGKTASASASESSKQSEPESTDPKSSDPKSSDPKSSEPKSSEPKSSELKSSEPKSNETKSSEPKSSEPKSSEPKSNETKSSAAGSSQTEQGEPPEGERNNYDDIAPVE